MIFRRSGAGVAWELLGEGESLYGGCQRETTRCGKLKQPSFGPQGGYRSARYVLAAKLFFAIFSRGTAVVAAPLPEGRYGLSGRRGAGRPICEIHSVLLEPTRPSRRGSLTDLCAFAYISGGEIEIVSVVGEALTVDCESRMGRVAAPMVALLAGFARKGGAGTGRRPAWGLLAPLAVSLFLWV